MALTIKQGLGKDMNTMGFHPKQGWKIIYVTFDSSYPTGGEDFDMGQPVHALVPLGGTRLYRYDATTKKLLAFDVTSTLFAEEGSGADLSAEVDIPFIAFLAEV